MRQAPIAAAARPFAELCFIGIAVAAIAEWLPTAAALISVIWTLIRIIESRTMRRLLRKCRARANRPPARQP